MANPFRMGNDFLANHSLVNPFQPINFRFDGRNYQGLQGDSLASALLANGVKLFGRSFKYHRRRGLLSAGIEEPNALVSRGVGARYESNVPATMVEIYQGLDSYSQNRFPSLSWDIQSINQSFAPFLGAGFYYKTFMGLARSTQFWMFCEKWIRRSAGLGKGPQSTDYDPDHYEHVSQNCDVLVIGGGRAGMQAAEEAARQQGQSVILVEQRPWIGGRILFESARPQGFSGRQFVLKQQERLASIGTIRILTRTMAFGYYDDNFVGLVESPYDDMAAPPHGKPRQRLWWVRAKKVIIASGAVEQLPAFYNNDVPGVMLAGAVRAYLNGYGVRTGKRMVVFAQTDEAYRTAFDGMSSNLGVAAIVDPRPASAIGKPVREAVEDLGIPHYTESHISEATRQNGCVASVKIAQNHSQRSISQLACDLVAVSAGWQPQIQLFSQSGGSLRYDESHQCYLADKPKQNVTVVGSAAAEGVRVVARQAPAVFVAESSQVTKIEGDNAPQVKYYHRRYAAKAFVDLQNDVTVADGEAAVREGYHYSEHSKRYTTAGMATDQGKTGSRALLNVLANTRGLSVAETGLTNFRPPYAPVSVGSLAGEAVGKHFVPLRLSPMDLWHSRQGCEWADNGLWRRPNHYPKPHESLWDSMVRETVATRQYVGICDISTLGKIDIQGPDAAKFLDHIYTNVMSSLPIGRVRYGLMLREDGFVFDDGTVTRVDESHFLISTSTSHAGAVLAKMEFYHQRDFPNYRLRFTSVTDQWAGISLAGPQSRTLLQRMTDCDVSNSSFPFMHYTEASFFGIMGRLFRISFSGELAYELLVPADYGQALWERIFSAGADLNLTPYGVEALSNMRIEKGHVSGGELYGRTTPFDLGLGKMLSAKKGCVGKPMAMRPHLLDPARPQLVGLIPYDAKVQAFHGGSLILPNKPVANEPPERLGHITSSGYSPELGIPIALALVSGGLERWHNQTLICANPIEGQQFAVKVVSPHFLDPKGERQNG